MVCNQTTTETVAVVCSQATLHRQGHDTCRLAPGCIFGIGNLVYGRFTVVKVRIMTTVSRPSVGRAVYKTGN